MNRLALTLLVALSVVVALLPGEASAIPNGGCLICHSGMGFSLPDFESSVHAEVGCHDCHRAFADDPHGRTEVPPPAQEWLAATVEAESTGADPLAWAACRDCHEDVFSRMARSAHVLPAVESGSADGAFCGDCHGSPHAMAATPTNVAERMAFVTASCETCHTDEALIEAYDLAPEVVFTFEESLHGRAARLGLEDAPSCVDCHNAHAVASGEDPESPINLQNRAEVCGSCHEGANENFASVFSHERITPHTRPLEYWVTFFFVSLTLIVILGMLVHIALDAYSNLRESARSARGGAR